ncbi:hypothetical protein [Anaeroarcus burkinensis]|uniref:hypothetical protein n=1 Tax=Anaeroarcus burkinensis TaxID=82376 RepID=UPI00047FC18D|nr:hypothetical protein [Anaeroarcus burkinensis]
MKKISVLAFCFFLLWGCSISFANIIRENDGDNVAFSSWQKFTDNNITTYCSLVKYIDLGASSTFWLRMDSNRGAFQERAYLQIDNNILQIKRLEAGTMYNRTGTPEPSILSPWSSTMYSLSATELDAFRKCSSIRLTLTLKDGKTMSYKLSPVAVTDWKRVLDLSSSSLAAPSMQKQTNEN